MEIKITTVQILKVLHVISWIIFLGVCVEAGSFIFNGLFTTLYKPEAADYFGLADLYAFDSGHFLVQLLLSAIPGVLKAIMFYLIVKILYDNKVNMAQPFSREMGRLIFGMAYLSLGIGVFSSWGVDYAKWLASQGVKMPDAETLQLDGAGVWIFMGILLIVIALIFKRGIEIQSENELTI